MAGVWNPGYWALGYYSPIYWGTVAVNPVTNYFEEYDLSARIKRAESIAGGILRAYGIAGKVTRSISLGGDTE